MNVNQDLTSRVADYYAAEAPPRAPDWVLQTALATVEITKQRRSRVRVPWRFPDMNSYAKFAVAAVAVVALGVVGLTLLRPADGPSVGGQSPSPSPVVSASPSSAPASPTLRATPNPIPTPPPLTGSFDSPLYGLSLSYPEGWNVVPGTKAWAGEWMNFDEGIGDQLHDPVKNSELFITASSMDLAGQSGEEWARALQLGDEPFCQLLPEPVTVDGSDGLRCGQQVAAWTADRGYFFRLYTGGDDPRATVAYEGAWFATVLETVQLTPETSGE
jgi:hypothetical protein